MKHNFKIASYSRRMEKILQSNGTRQQAGIFIIIADKMALIRKLMKRDKGRYFTVIKEIVFKSITILNI